MFPKPGDNASSREGSNAGSFSSLFGNKADMDNFGGQGRGPDSRCFTSSLLEMSKGSLNPKFPSYGLCYRSNCYRPNYLQVAIRGQLDKATYWYKCPEHGGKL